jgi:hypothetical protein
MTRAFLSHADTTTSVSGTTTRERTNESDVSTKHTLNCLFDKSVHLDNAKQIVSWLNISLDDLAGSK